MVPGLLNGRRSTVVGEGVVYCATGERRFVDQAAISARSVRKASPGLEIVLMTDRAVGIPDVFDRAVPTKTSGDPKFDKSGCLLESPFERTIFLDVDTYVGGGLDEIFALLERFDVAAAHAPNRATTDTGLPSAFPELNTGVIGIRRNDRTERLLAGWHRLQGEERTPPPSRDQPSFRRAVWESDARVAVLPPEFNCRFYMAGVYNTPVAILHGFASEDAYERILETLNSQVSGPYSQHVYSGGLLFGPHDAPRVLGELR